MVYLVGQSLGRYHILEQLGEGGMAVVYKAFDTLLGREVAVKVIRIDQLAPAILERAMKRFEREAKAVAKLNHPNIVKVIDYGEYEDQPYLVMEYMPGGTLKQLIQEKGRLSWQDAARMIIKIADALEYAHKQKVIHRDIKPSNILLTAENDPILTDFGVAKVLDEETTQDLTGTSASVGTPEYMAPEQVTNKMVDHRADIYALGIVFYEMVTGRKPYNADTPLAVLFKHISDPLPRPRDYVEQLPEGVEWIIFTALAKKPEDRYQSMEVFSKALEGLLNYNGSQKNPLKESQNQVDNCETMQKADIEDDAGFERNINSIRMDQISETRNKRRKKKKKHRFGVIIIISLTIVFGTIAFLFGFTTSLEQLLSLRLKNETITQSPTTTNIPSSSPTLTTTPTDQSTPPPQYYYDAILSENANCRSGPGIMYPVVQNCRSGEKVRAIAQNPENDWFFVLKENSYNGCWVLSSLFSFDEKGSLPSDLQLFTPIPTPVITKVVNKPKIYIKSEQKTHLWLISYEVSNLIPNSPITIIWFEGLIDGDRNYINTRAHNYFFLTSDEYGVCTGQFNIQSGEYTFKVIDQTNSTITIEHFIVK